MDSVRFRIVHMDNRICRTLHISSSKHFAKQVVDSFSEIGSAEFIIFWKSIYQHSALDIQKYRNHGLSYDNHLAYSCWHFIFRKQSYLLGLVML
jgi:hypothetical protein